MDKKDEKTEKESCCESGGSCGCCGRRCCSGKAAFVLVLLLIGGLIGYGMGRCHGSHWACPYSSMGAPMGVQPSPSK